MEHEISAPCPADNWFYRITPGFHPITPHDVLQVTSFAWFGQEYAGSPAKPRQCTLHLHYFEYDGHDDILKEEIIGVFSSETVETALNVILESHQNFIFELTAESDCEIILFGQYLKDDPRDPDTQLLPNHTVDDVDTLIGESKQLNMYTDSGENGGGVSVDPDANGVEDRDLQDVSTHDDLVGTGDTVTMGSKVIMWYTAKIFETGEVYDSIDASTGDPAMITLGSNEVISGWEKGMIGMRVGGSRTIMIPPKYAYGTQGQGSVVPPNATIEIKCMLIGQLPD